MRRLRLAFRVFAPLVVLSAAVIALLGAASALAMRRLYAEATLATLAQTARALANEAPPLAGPRAAGAQAAADFCAAASRGTALRVTLIAPDGRVAGDSVADPAGMDNHAGRPEISEALAGRAATSLRDSPTLGMAMAYAASPLGREGERLGVLRLAMGVPELAAGTAPYVAAFALAAVLLALTIAAAGIRLGVGVATPLRALAEAAGHWSVGRLDRRVRRFDDPELGPLADTMNAMAGELAARISAMAEQRRELEAVLDAMDEAVLSVDASLRVRLANPKAASLLRRNEDRASLEGRDLLEATGMVALEDLARRCASEGRLVESEFSIYGDETRHLIAKASPLAMTGDSRGAVIALNDVTRLKRLERIRKDFVANVSHELRTPITLIKGFAETLESVDDPTDAARFVAVIKRHADRMAASIDDLLMLARLEGPDRGVLELARVEAEGLLARAVEEIRLARGEEAALLVVEAGSGLELRANEGLLEQALVNLIDNAVKYGPSGAPVKVGAVSEGGFVRLYVADEGPGIPARDQSRLFERFYRVDKARSRKLGGTGLGLAIVRHIALAHGGDVSVQSREGSGSVFSIRVPAWAESVQAASPSSETTSDSS